MIRFAAPYVLLLVFLVPFFVSVFRKNERKLAASLRFSDGALVRDVKRSFREKLAAKLVWMRALCLFLLVLAVARPQVPIEGTKISVEGTDIVLCIDCSGSMQAMDFDMGGRKFDRLTIVKNVVEEFIKKRPNDRIGIVAFSAQAYSISPLTLDHEWLEKNLDRVRIGLIEDGTAIGLAIVGSLNRLRKSEAKDRVIILLTDGRNNTGNISPTAAAEAAKTMGVRIYTIGAGTKGPVPFPMKDMFGNTVLQPVEIEIDEDLLREIADETGGKYFRATDTEELWNIYKEIDRLEKVKIEETGYKQYNEVFGLFLLPALCLFLLEIVLSNTFLKRIP